jgi:hypothetical protein
MQSPLLTPLRARELAILAGIFVFLILMRLPALSGPLNLSHDATEYIDIARNFAAGEGLVLKIRAYFSGDSPAIPYPAISLRSVLFPAAMGAAYSWVRSDAVFRLFNLGLFLINMLLLLLILKPFLSFRLLALSLLLAGLSEPMFLTSIFPWTEQTAFLWLLAAMLAASRDLHLRWGPLGMAVEGIFAGMAAISRPEYFLAGPLLLAWQMMARKKPRMSSIGALAAGFLIPLALLSACSYREFGQAYFPGSHLFRSREYQDYFSWDRAGQPAPAGFLVSNWLFIAGRVLRNFANYLAKLIGYKNLFFLAAALPFVLRSLADRSLDHSRRLLLLVPAGFFAAYCLVWAGMDRERYLLPITTFLLPFCLLQVNEWRARSSHEWVRAACIVIMAVNVPLFAGKTVASGLAVRSRERLGERFYARTNPAWSNPDMDSLARWIRENVGAGEVICLENPFLANYLTGRCTLLLPQQMPPTEFVRFLAHYRAQYWVNNVTFTNYPRGELDNLEQVIKQAGAELAAVCGTYRVWKLESRP